MTHAEFVENYYVPPDGGVASGTSIFDPVLCELVYRWFSSGGDVILDPFAGGSVRGIVSSLLGRQYYGIELRPEQVEANLRQVSICKGPEPRWIEGDSFNLKDLVGGMKADLIFTCPPYVNLEVYSDMPGDISNMPYHEFLSRFAEIMRGACECLNEDRFVCVTVGDVRGKGGNYYGFVADTVKILTEAGLSFYNEAILVNNVVSAAIRAARPFEQSRKLCKLHQNVLIFIKGNARKATERLGPCEFGDIEADYSE